jgi:hypothetical protein
MPRFSSPKPSIINSCDSRLSTSSCEQCALAKIQDLNFTILDIPSQLAYKILVWIMKHGKPCSSNLRSRWMTLTDLKNGEPSGTRTQDPRLNLKGERRVPLIWCWGHSSRTEHG